MEDKEGEFEVDCEKLKVAELDTRSVVLWLKVGVEERHRDTEGVEDSEVELEVDREYVSLTDLVTQ